MPRGALGGGPLPTTPVTLINYLSNCTTLPGPRTPAVGPTHRGDTGKTPPDENAPGRLGSHRDSYTLGPPPHSLPQRTPTVRAHTHAHTCPLHTTLGALLVYLPAHVPAHISCAHPHTHCLTPTPDEMRLVEKPKGPGHPSHAPREGRLDARRTPPPPETSYFTVAHRILGPVGADWGGGSRPDPTRRPQTHFRPD